MITSATIILAFCFYWSMQDGCLINALLTSASTVFLCWAASKEG